MDNLKQVREEYEKVVGKKVTNKKNDIKWMQDKIDEVKKEDIKNELENIELVEVKEGFFKLNRNVKCGGKYYFEGHEFTQEDGNYNIFKNFID